MPVLEPEDGTELDSTLVHGVCTIYDDVERALANFREEDQ